jgi:hypothetical protein
MRRSEQGDDHLPTKAPPTSRGGPLAAREPTAPRFRPTHAITWNWGTLCSLPARREANRGGSGSPRAQNKRCSTHRVPPEPAKQERPGASKMTTSYPLLTEETEVAEATDSKGKPDEHA